MCGTTPGWHELDRVAQQVGNALRQHGGNGHDSWEIRPATPLCAAGAWKRRIRFDDFLQQASQIHGLQRQIACGDTRL